MTKKMKSVSAGRTLGAKGMSTRTTVLNAALEVFNEKGYYGSSVSEITRRCGVSMGTFYQYFKNKEQIFMELNDLITGRFWERANGQPGKHRSFQGRVSNVVSLLYEHTRENFYFHRILGEFELIDPVTIGYYDAIARFYRNFFRQEAAKGSIRPLDPNLIAYGLIGIVYFHSLDWGPEEDVYEPGQLVEMTVDLIRKGISGPKPWFSPQDLTISSFPDKVEGPIEPETNLAQGQKTRRTIFQAAERVFGKHGFNRASISEITRLAGVAQGTFYVHFKSKGDLLEGFVRYLSHELRRALKLATKDTVDRRDAEREGMLAFFKFLKSHRQIYRVVAESETLGHEVSMWYYKRLAKGYIYGLQQGVQKGDIRELSVVFAVRSLMGFNHMIGLKWLVWKSFPHAELPGSLLADAVRLVIDGLDPS